MSKKTVLNQIKTLLNIEVKLEMMKLDNGTTIEASSFEPDYEVFVVSVVVGAIAELAKVISAASDNAAVLVQNVQCFLDGIK